MNVRFSRAIDRVVGTPLCWMLNVLTWSVGVVLRRPHAPPYAPKRILVIKLMGVGSIVQALPLLDGLAGRYPGAELRMLCFPETEIFAKRLHPVASVFTIDNRSLLALARTSLTALVAILQWRPDLVLDLEFHSKFSSLLTTITAAPNRGGLFDVTTAFRNRLHTHLVYANPRQHICDLYCHLGRAFGVESFKSLADCAGYIRIQPGEEDEASRFVATHSPHRPILLVNANAGELCLERRWPSDRFAVLAAGLVDSGTVMLVGSPAERDHVESIRQLIPDEGTRAKVLNSAGALSFGGYLALLKRAALMVTNDSGPMHLAAVLGAPVVSLWGPGESATYEPRTPRHVAVSEHVFCSPCLYITHQPPCGGENICMTSMPVGRVLDAARALVPALSIAPSPVVPLRRAAGDSLPGLVLRHGGTR